MRAGWSESSLEKVCDLIKRGVAPKYTDIGGICVINQKCIRNHDVNYEPSRRHDITAKSVNPERYIRFGDVLVNSTGTGTLGRVAQVRKEPNEPTIVDTHVTIVRPKRGLFYPEFFGYMMIKIEDEITVSGEGASGQTELPRTKLAKDFKVAYPHSIKEQKRIVAILDEAFAGIDAAIANTEKNLANARELFENYLNEVFARKGDGWVEQTLGAVCQIKPPKKQAKELLSETDLISFVPMSDLGIRQKEIYLKEERPLGKVIGSYTYFAENDVLLAKITPCFENGKLGIARGLTNGIGFGSSEYVVFRSNGKVEPEYLFYFLSQNSFRDEGAKVMTGAVGHKRVPKEFIENYLIPLPSLIEQKSIVAKLDSLNAEVKRLESIYQQN